MRSRHRLAALSFRVAAAASALVPAAALAAAPKPAPEAAAVQAVLDCRAVADSAARLACYDSTAAKMEQARRQGDIVVIDRAQAEAAHREAFGLALPSMDFVSKALGHDEADRIEAVVESAREDEVSRRWVLRLQGGAVWRQIDGSLDRPPHSGSKVSIRRGAVGSYLVNVDGQPAVKFHRDQ